jgi:hypothetical protein
MPKASLLSFSRDVAAGAHKGKAPNAQNAKDLSVSKFCLQRWPKGGNR